MGWSRIQKLDPDVNSSEVHIAFRDTRGQQKDGKREICTPW